MLGSVVPISDTSNLVTDDILNLPGVGCCGRYDMTLKFSEAIFGAEKEFELSHLETCEVCTGTGAKIGSKMRICSTCGGRGQVMRTEQTPFGLFSQVFNHN
ncbi:Chaperone protein DnaJ [Vitis vinifera]|uniref:Chaperone protein DnaJ n=1 Tax=Vitis vinifera TaxID=29760 RepID=A0A438I5Z3_VITVI|nr:Chaperone protein DnaJ [Vitis vinifera]